MDRDKDGGKENRKYPCPAPCLNGSALSRTGRRTRRWEPEEAHFPGLHTPSGSGARFLPGEVQAEPPEFPVLLGNEH